MSGIYLHSPNTPSWRGAQLKHKDNFTFTQHDMPVVFHGRIERYTLWVTKHHVMKTYGEVEV